MRLKCIKLSGFKSFVDPTTIDFPSNLCAVVGPNGCGKSNVIDAVRWVMGESSAKNLRGEQMTDVIFNGSGGRKPVGQASVELVFDNHDHKLTGEYANYAEVSIRRKVDREAISTYYLNGAKCRRKDITDIFLGTGLGARSYSIIEQGMVSRLIESKPEELRVYIEEAAGISKYKERRKETESRIKRTRENLERLQDIRDELERQLNHLQRQSVAAEKYGELKQQERQTAANLAALRWQKLDAEIRHNQEAVGRLEIEIEAQNAEKRRVDASIEQHLSDNTELTDALGEVQARYYSLGNDIARIEQSIEHHTERVGQLKLDLTETEEGWNQTREELDVDLKKITQLDTELREISPLLEQAQVAEQESAAALDAAEQSQQHWQKEWDEFNQRAEEPRQTAEVEQTRIQQLEQIVERSHARSSKLRAELEELADIEVPQDDVDLLAQVPKLETKVNEERARNSDLGQQLIGMRSQSDRLADEEDQARSELQRLRGQLASLEALQQAALGQDDEAINTWLADKGFGYNKRLAEILSINDGWEVAVETVLGNSLQSICVNGLDNVQDALTNIPAGRLGLLDMNAAITSEPQVSALTPLLQQVRCDANLGELLAGIYIAENFGAALSQRAQLRHRESIVTRDGLWVGKSWIQLQSGDGAESAIRRKSLIEEISLKIREKEIECDVVSQKRATLKASIHDLEQEREQVQVAASKAAEELSELKSELGALQAKTEEAAARRKRIELELAELEQQVQIETENTAQSRLRLQQALDSMEADVGNREHLQIKREESQQALESSRSKAREHKDEVHDLALRQQSVESQLKSTRETMDRMASQVQRSKERIESLTDQIEKSDQPLEAMRSDLESLLQQRLEVEKELGIAKANVEANEHELRALEQERNEIQEKISSIRESVTENRLKSEGASVKREGLIEQLAADKFELDAVIAGLPEDLDVETCEAELEKLGNRIQRLGPINLAAIDEYKQQSERKIYLDRQNEDLEKALNTLRNAIRKIDKETRTRFKDTFDKINDGLQNLFPKVFGGGHAYLDMTGEDLLDTGVAIMARPPGKRNSTIHLLSGGEKAMTAIALVFSIFHLNPSPFCMLDEVDAPLDDANVGRYANLVKEMAEYVQFIFITHNKITMEMAHQLMGVTMHEAGVSRIVAVDIDEAAELAAS